MTFAAHLESGLSEQDLAKIERHMRVLDRIHLGDGRPWDAKWRGAYCDLVDDVPILMAEVRRLREVLGVHTP